MSERGTDAPPPAESIADRPAFPRLPESLARQLRRARVGLMARRQDLHDRRRPLPPGTPELPPAALRYRVHGSVDREDFLDFGRRWSGLIRGSLAGVGTDLSSLDHILDFGCGAGRTLIWLAEEGGPRLAGTDIDAPAIDWCRRHLPGGRFEVNASLPPIDFESESFDLVYAISVFTHLPAEYQLRWLMELRRVLRPGGFALLTVRGETLWGRMPREQREAVERTGFGFVRYGVARGEYPEWYGDANQTREWTLERYGEHFEILEYEPGGRGRHRQDLVLLRRPA